MNTITSTRGRTAAAHRFSRRRSFAPLARRGFVLAVTIAICLATVTVAWASVPETNNQWSGPAVTSQGDVTKAKTGANTDVGQIVQPPAATPSSGHSNNPLVVGIALAAAGAGVLVVLGWLRRRIHSRAASVSSLPGPRAARGRTKAA